MLNFQLIVEKLRISNLNYLADMGNFVINEIER